MSDGEWDFVRSDDEELSIEGAVFQALGGASTCWVQPDGTPGTGELVFDSERAKVIGDKLVAYISHRIGPSPAPATGWKAPRWKAL